MTKQEQTQQTEGWEKQVESLIEYEVCDNPDHVGYVDVDRKNEGILLNNDDFRIGCPLCGHDPEHRILSTRHIKKIADLKNLIRTEIEKAYQDGFAEGLDEGKEYADEAVEVARREGFGDGRTLEYLKTLQIEHTARSGYKDAQTEIDIEQLKQKYLKD